MGDALRDLFPDVEPIFVLGGYSSGKSWMEFPAAVWPVLLLSYFFITI